MTAGDRHQMAILVADIDHVTAAMVDAREQVEAALDGDGRVPVEPHAMAFIAVTLAHYYNAYEDALERAARSFDGQLPEGPAWHVELLRRASLELSRLRPALLQREYLASARELMTFSPFPPSRLRRAARHQQAPDPG